MDDGHALFVTMYVINMGHTMRRTNDDLSRRKRQS